MPPAIICEAPRAVDGDNIRCANITESIRLLGIDAPEMGKCRKRAGCAPGSGPAAKQALAELLRRGPVVVAPEGKDRYGRVLARVSIGTIDLSCEMLAAGHAISRYSKISC